MAKNWISVKRGFLYGVAALALSRPCYAAEASADTTSDSTPSSEQTSQDTPEIIVTAQKRNERLKDVPLSITAASGEQLANRGVVSVGDLQTIVPGFNFVTSNYGQPVLSIRGIGFYDNSIGVAPTVSVYVDQTPLPYSAMTQGASLDLERVEVLKGPQGTLFGQNSTGGAINYIAAKPTDSLHAGAEVTYGRFNELQASGFVSGPLSDSVKARAAFRIERRDGWQRTYIPDPNSPSRPFATNGERNLIVGRALVDWQASDRLKFELNVNAWHDASDTQAAQFVAYSPQLPQPIGRPDQLVLASLAPAPSDARAAEWDPGFSLKKNDRFYQVALRGDLDLGGGTQLTSITSYSHAKIDDPIDVDGSAFNDFRITTKGRLSSLSEELRISGSVENSLKWMVGANYAYDKSDDDQYGDSRGSNSWFGPGLAWDHFLNTNHQRVHTAAAFASADYKLSDQLSFQLSGRYTNQRRDFEGCFQDVDGAVATAFGAVLSPVPIPVGGCATLGANGLPGPARLKLDENNFSWRANVSWKPAYDTLLYANVTKGYKSGGFSTVPGIFIQQFQPVPQESVLAYEAGVRSDILGKAASFSGAGFYYDYKDKQLLGFVFVPPFGPLPGLVTIPKSRVVGAEANLTLRPFSGLKMDIGGTYVSSKVLGSYSGFTPYGVAKDFGGERFPNTPTWQFTASAEYQISMRSGANLTFGADVNGRSAAYSAFGENPDFNLAGYSVVNLRTSFETADGRWRVQVFGKNVFNKLYHIDVSKVIDAVARTAGMPVTYGVTVGYRY